MRAHENSSLAGPSKPEMCVVTLDVGTSSVRTLLFDERGREVGDFGAHIPYEVQTTADGGVEIDADELAGLAVQALSEVHAQMKAARLRPSAVAFSASWHNVLGVSADTQSAHVKFKTKYELPFTLLADPERLTGEDYGVNREGSRTFERSTFVIDAEGNVAKIMRRVNPETHAAQVLEALG